MLRVTALALVLVAAAPGVARGRTSWSWPVHGRIVGGFSFSAAVPYAPGRHRGIAIAAAPGSPVLAVCASRVAFAGSVGRAGRTVSLDCGGGLRATFQGLASVRVRAGESVPVAAPVATLGIRGVLHLGARIDLARDVRYLDPAGLLRASAPAAPPLVPVRRVGPAAPLGPAPRPVPRSSAGSPVGSARALSRRLPSPARPRGLGVGGRRPPRPATTPLLAWLGLAALAVAAPIGTLRRSRPAGFRAWALRQLRGAARG